MNNNKEIWVFGDICCSVLLILSFLSGSYSSLWAMDEKTYASLMRFSKVLEEINANYVDEIDPEVLVTQAIHGMMASLDPFSGYLEPGFFKALNDRTQGEFGGVGISLDKIADQMIITSIILDTPAYRAGMKKGDAIIRINEKPTFSLDLLECSALLKGPPGTKVQITYVRKNVKDKIVSRLTRDLIPVESVLTRMLTLDGTGYIAVKLFQANTIDDFIDGIENIEASDSGLSGLILDLRNNPGGHLDQAVQMSDLFLEQGIIVSIKGRRKNQYQVFKAQENEVKRDYPIVVLINGGSASASEIVAGALKDHKRAVILGTPSFGKGSVQTIVPLDELSGIKYTIARYYTPNNLSIQDKGIQPDVEIANYINDSTLVEPELEKIRASILVFEFKKDNLVLRALEILTVTSNHFKKPK
jgi:carboxyl-terminal processing protease